MPFSLLFALLDPPTTQTNEVEKGEWIGGGKHTLLLAIKGCLDTREKEEDSPLPRFLCSFRPPSCHRERKKRTQIGTPKRGSAKANAELRPSKPKKEEEEEG